MQCFHDRQQPRERTGGDEPATVRTIGLNQFYAMSIDLAIGSCMFRFHIKPFLMPVHTGVFPREIPIV